MITLGGDLKISGPKVREQLQKGLEAEVTYGKSNIEFRLSAESDEKDNLTFPYLWLDFSDDRIVIRCPDAIDEELPSHSFNIEIKGQKGETIDLTLTGEQARAIAEIFSNVVQMFDFSEKLQSPKIA